RAERVEQPHRHGTHRGEVVEVDQDTAPAGPLGITLHDGREDRVAGRHDVRTGYRGAVVADEPDATKEPAAGRAACQQGSQRAVGGCGQGRDALDRPAHQHMWRAGHRGRTDRVPAQPGEQHLVAGLDGGFEPEHAGVLRPGAGRPDQCRADPSYPSGRPVDRQPAAGPPPEILAAADRAETHAADDGTGPVAGHEHDRTGVLVTLIAVVTGEQALLLDERPDPQGSIGSDRSGVTGRFNVEGRRPLAEQCRAEPMIRSLTLAHAPAACRTPHAPQAAQPACWSAPYIPAARSSAATRSVTSRTSSAAGAPMPSRRARVPTIGRNGTTNGYTPRSISRAAPATISSGSSPSPTSRYVLTRLRPKTRTASSHAASYAAIGTVALPGIHRRRTSSSMDSTW